METSITASTPISFATPEEIGEKGKRFGTTINNFSEAGKNLAKTMQGLGMAQENIIRLVGHGFYNGLEAPGGNFVLRGPEEHREARKQPLTGLFGAFFHVHSPEMFMCARATKLLGDAGCKLQFTDAGQIYEIPLQQVKFGFEPQRIGAEKQRLRQACITVTEPVTMISADGATMPVAAGTPIMFGREWLPRRTTHGLPTGRFTIVDGRNQGLSELACAYALWGQQGARGMKALRQNSPELYTLQVTGTDDDFTAERAMVAWMELVRQQNNIDLMPQFNAFVVKSQQALLERSDLLGAMNESLAFCHTMVSKLDSLKTQYQHDSTRIYDMTQEARLWHSLDMFARIQTYICETATKFGLPVEIPAVRAALTTQMAEDACKAFPEALRNARMEDMEIAQKEAKRRHAEREMHERAAHKAAMHRMINGLTDAVRPQGSIFDYDLWNDGKGYSFSYPGQQATILARCNELIQVGSSEVTVESLLAQACQQKAQKSIGRELTAMGNALTQLPRREWFVKLSKAYPQDAAPLQDAARKAAQSIEAIRDGMSQKPPHVPRLKEWTADIAKATKLIDEGFGLATPTGAVRLFKERLGNVHPRRKLDAGQHQWEGTSAMCHEFVNLMDQVDADAGCWLAMYRNVDGLLAPQSKATSHVEQLARQSEYKNGSIRAA